MTDGSGRTVPRETVPEPPDAARTVFGERLPQASAYVAWLAEAGIQRGLLGPREVPRLWERHVLNCAVVAELTEDSESVADIGSGAGLPGIPMALARPDLRMVLVEPMMRRADFLHETVERLGLSSVSVLRARAEEVVQEVAFDVATARAVAKLDRLAAWCMPLLRPGGRMLALKGASVHDELRDIGGRLRAAGASSWTVETVGSNVLDPATVVAVVAKK